MKKKFILILIVQINAKSASLGTNCNLDKGTMMDILDIGMRDVSLRPYFTEIFFDNDETREFMDRLLIECRLDKGLTNNLSHRSRNLLLKIFDESEFLRRDLLDKLNIEKLLLLDISARIQNYDGIVTKLHSEALATDDIEVLKLLNKITLKLSSKSKSVNWMTCLSLKNEQSDFKKCIGLESHDDAILYDEFLNHPRIQEIIKRNHLNEEVDYINRILVGILNPRKKKAQVKSAGILASFLKSGSCTPAIPALTTLVITSMILL